MSESKASKMPLCPILSWSLVMAMLMLFRSMQLAWIVSGRSEAASPTVWLKASTKPTVPGPCSPNPRSLKRLTTSARPCSVVT